MVGMDEEDEIDIVDDDVDLLDDEDAWRPVGPAEAPSHQALPAMYNLMPVDMARMRDTMFAGAESEAPTTAYALQQQTEQCWQQPASPFQSLPSLFAPSVATQQLSPITEPLAVMQQPQDNAGLADVGLALGRSFRVGWGSGGKLAVICGRHGTKLDIRQLQVGGSLGMSGAASVAVLRSMLTVHSQQSKAQRLPNDPLPHWSLHCSRRSQLQPFCDSLSRAAEEHASGRSEEAEEQHLRICLQTLSWTWSLVAHLFVDLEFARTDEEDMDAMSGVSDRGCELLAQHERHARISRWLEERTKDDALRAIAQCSGSALEAIAHLMSTHRVRAACGIAAQIGDVRLSTLLLQGGRSAVQHNLQQQLKVWEEHKMLEYMDDLRVALYTMLSGDPERLMRLVRLDWHRCLGLFYWYVGGAVLNVEQALQSYEDAVRAMPDACISPVSWFADQRGLRINDLHYELLRTFTAAERNEQCSLTRLMHPLAVSGDVLDFSLQWHLMTLLMAIGVIRLPDEVCVNKEVQVACDVAMTFVLQLLCSPELSCWAVYVALQLPTAVDAAIRRRAVVETLTRQCPAWCGNDEAVALLEQFNVGRKVLAEAQALWHGSSGRHHLQFEFLLKAEKWDDALDVWLNALMPQLFLCGMHDALQQHLHSLRHAQRASSTDWPYVCVPMLAAFYQMSRETQFDAIAHAAQSLTMSLRQCYAAVQLQPADKVLIEHGRQLLLVLSKVEECCTQQLPYPDAAIFDASGLACDTLAFADTFTGSVMA